jgi:hypothetical protein
MGAAIFVIWCAVPFALFGWCLHNLLRGELPVRMWWYWTAIHRSERPILFWLMTACYLLPTSLYLALVVATLLQSGSH